MSWLMTLYTALLFVVLVPGVLVTLPPGGKKLTVALVHGLVFALLLNLTHKTVARLLSPYEGFTGTKKAGEACMADADCATDLKCDAPTKKCVPKA